MRVGVGLHTDAIVADGDIGDHLKTPTRHNPCIVVERGLWTRFNLRWRAGSVEGPRPRGPLR